MANTIVSISCLQYKQKFVFVAQHRSVSHSSTYIDSLSIFMYLQIYISVCYFSHTAIPISCPGSAPFPVDVDELRVAEA